MRRATYQLPIKILLINSTASPLWRLL